MNKRKKDEILYYIKTILVILLLIIASISYIMNMFKKQKELEAKIISLQEENTLIIKQNNISIKLEETIKARYNIDKCPVCESDVIIECIAKDFRINCPNCGLHTEYVDSIEKAASIWKIIVEADGDE